MHYSYYRTAFRLTCVPGGTKNSSMDADSSDEGGYLGTKYTKKAPKNRTSPSERELACSRRVGGYSPLALP